MSRLLWILLVHLFLFQQGEAVSLNPGSIEINVPLEIHLPLPMRGGAPKPVTPPEVVSQSGNKSRLLWQGLKATPGAQEALVSEVALVEVSSKSGKIQPEDVVLKFASDSGIERTKLVRSPHLKAPGEVIQISDFSFGTVIEINTTLAGWRPGNTTFFLISKDQTKVVKIDPAWHMRFDWNKANVYW